MISSEAKKEALVNKALSKWIEAKKNANLSRAKWIEAGAPVESQEGYLMREEIKRLTKIANRAEGVFSRMIG
jgi:hypothetical protein